MMTTSIASRMSKGMDDLAVFARIVADPKGIQTFRDEVAEGLKTLQAETDKAKALNEDTVAKAIEEELTPEDQVELEKEQKTPRKRA